MTRALILIDIQNDYFPGGAMELAGMEEASALAGTALEEFRRRGLPVWHVRHESVQPGATFFLPGTPGAEIHPSVAPLENEAVIEKHWPNAFRETSLLDQLRSEAVEDLVICGAMSHMCIDATTRAAFDLGFRCTLLADACATRGLFYDGVEVPAGQVHAAFMAALSMPYASVVDTGTWRRALATR